MGATHDVLRRPQYAYTRHTAVPGNLARRRIGEQSIAERSGTAATDAGKRR
ncbi:MAG: hypothetical protein R3E89_04275 [Thiolinea sp.]